MLKLRGTIVKLIPYILYVNGFEECYHLLMLNRGVKILESNKTFQLFVGLKDTKVKR